MSTIEKSRAGRRVKGFTLMELIIVIAIIGVLLGVLLPTMKRWAGCPPVELVVGVIIIPTY